MLSGLSYSYREDFLDNNSKTNIAEINEVVEAQLRHLTKTFLGSTWVANGVVERSDLRTLSQTKMMVQLAESDSVNVLSTYFSYVEKLKDVVSFTGENATPSNVECKSVDLKRDFDEVYDADDAMKGVIKGLCGDKRSTKDLGYLKKMSRQLGCDPNKETYFILVDGLCEDGSYIETRQVMEKMLVNLYWPNSDTFGRVIRGICLMGRPYELTTWLEEMVSHETFLRGLRSLVLLFMIQLMLSATPPSNKRRYSLSSNGMTSTNSSTIEKTSSIMKLSSGQHRLRRKTVNVSDIPTIDLTSDEELNDEQQPGDIIAGISQDYLDHGDQTVICELCHAKLWRDEALRGRRCGMKTSYSLYCLYGKVELSKEKEMPTNYANLFRCNEFRQLLGPLTNEQRGVYDDIITTVQNNQGGVFFVYGYGGTGGRTSHSCFQIPLILNEDSLCYIKPDSDVAKLIKKTRLIKWDEAPMVH
ncbi:hypothetical protein L6452_14817 [Arctium lappa]|uniref:Uncharacterized protein n=1 Tax=Arctium lappa TaxID=4217 RepID=A0ACB9CM01_ARCLA|nr:hypothetical protein L6452_14817 [Arctium lappa]